MPRPIKPNSQLPDSTRRLHEVLEERRISRKKFAADIGITPSGVSSLFQNGRAITRLQAAAIETRYGISEKWLLDGEGPKSLNRYADLTATEVWLLELGLPEYKTSFLTMVRIPRLLAEQYFHENSENFRKHLKKRRNPDEALIQQVDNWQRGVEEKFDEVLAALMKALPVKISAKELSDLSHSDYAPAQLRQWQTARYYFMDLTVPEEEWRPSNFAKKSDIDLDWINQQRDLFLKPWRKLFSQVIENLSKPEDE